MKKILFALLLLITTFATQVLAQVPAGPGQVPQTLHIQSVLIDDGGNVLYNQQEADILFQIVNAQDQVLYQETQHVYIIKGTMSVLIGEGNDVSNGNPTGGIPPSVFDPRTGEKMVRYKLANQTVYSEDLKLATVPYSNYAGYALDVASPLNSQQIADGGIEPVDLSQNTIDFLNDSVTTTTQAEFNNHRTQRDAHTARNIAIQNAFVYIRGTNLQASVESIDATFNLFREYDRQMQAQISQLIGDITNLPATITTIADQRITNAIATNTVAAGNHNHDSRYIEEAGDTMTGDLNMGGQEITNIGPNNLTLATTLQDHETRITNLQNRAQATILPIAMARCVRVPSGSDYPTSEVNLTATGVSPFPTFSCDDHIRYDFVIPPVDTNYIIHAVVADEHCRNNSCAFGCGVIAREPDYFILDCSHDLSYEVVVFGAIPPPSAPTPP